MAHIPYEYKIVDGKAEIDEEQDGVVRALFERYISGLALKVAVEQAGLNIYYGSAGRMLRNTHYLGDEYYPAIIGRAIFDKAEEIRVAKAGALGRIRELDTASKVVADTSFTINPIQMKFKDPFAQAEYAYSLIESEVAAVE